MKNLYYGLLGIIVSVIVVLASIPLYLRSIPLTNNAQGTIYELSPGTSKKTFLAHLNKLHILPHSALFMAYIYAHPRTPLKTGEYYFPPRVSLYTVWQQVTTGTGHYYRSFTIVPGWTFKQLQEALRKAPGLKIKYARLPPSALLAALADPTATPEGLFFPDTYFYTKGDSDAVILKKAHALMRSTLATAWQQRYMNLPYQSSYQALTAASLVEKEALLSEEYVRIAGVLVNRLKLGMRLQFDPTVIYGMGDRYQGKITKKDLLADTLYNTYVHKGLPPTPIAMPSARAIRAALQPEEHRYYYFVARGDGSHTFSQNLGKHNQAVTAMLSRAHLKKGERYCLISNLTLQHKNKMQQKKKRVSYDGYSHLHRRH